VEQTSDSALPTGQDADTSKGQGLRFHAAGLVGKPANNTSQKPIIRPGLFRVTFKNSNAPNEATPSCFGTNGVSSHHKQQAVRTMFKFLASPIVLMRSMQVSADPILTASAKRAAQAAAFKNSLTFRWKHRNLPGLQLPVSDKLYFSS
jgi:hypothetical protein